ncbi:two-component sensor histidine kinase [Azospirillum sp. OGB3]|uniref:sensor histidine kinase n=1 Tax=Azospirillum sp. OGB3 TaxID=2587012 RepID=UPI001605D8EF|nr:sensor histidine kinase [Azospirillum sp. OGB3]MBB3264900.1 two-component sensor histidine kinase [Azospirillum sp. OGB3]
MQLLTSVSPLSPPLIGLARRNISRHLLSVVVTAMAAMAAIAISLVAWNLATQRRFAAAEMAITVRAIAAALDQQLLVTTSALEALAATMVVDGDPERLYRVAQAVKDKHSHWSHVTLRDADGSVVFSTKVPYGTSVPTIADIGPELAEAMTTGQPQISGLLYGPIANEHVGAVLVPIQAKDSKRYALIAAVTTSKWETLLREQPIPDGWVAGIIDRNGVVVARTRAAEQFVGKPAPGWVRKAIQTAPTGQATGPALEGEPLSLVFSRSKVSGWAVAFAAPASVFEDPLRRSLWSAAAISVLALGCASLLVLRYARRLSRSVTGLVQVAEALQTPGAALPPPPPINLEELASVYDTMRNTSVLLRRAEDQRIMSMRELQHRVKNDLQAILSLLALEGGQAKSEETIRILEELQGRVEALRLVHSRLYEASQVGVVELGDYLVELCANAVALHGRNLAGGIALRTSVDHVYVDHNTAVSLGLIANEFITNSAKHAFPQGSGTITLALLVAKPGEIHLRLSDNGVGLPPERMRSSGLELIAMLAEQVGAESAWTTSPQTSLRLLLHTGGAGQAS